VTDMRGGSSDSCKLEVEIHSIFGFGRAGLTNEPPPPPSKRPLNGQLNGDLGTGHHEGWWCVDPEFYPPTGTVGRFRVARLSTPEAFGRVATASDVSLDPIDLDDDSLETSLTSYLAASRGDPGYGTFGDRLARFCYLSAVTITTLGFGDVVPISGVARLAIATEVILGVVIGGMFLNALVNNRPRIATTQVEDMAAVRD
jgi:Ion channel